MNKYSYAYADVSEKTYDEVFLDESLRMFNGMGRGEVGKYMYDNADQSGHTNIWEDIVAAKTDYYVPQADLELMNQARQELPNYIPAGSPYIDFGVGSKESFKRYVLQTMQLMGSSHYYGVDIDYKILHEVKSLQPTLKHTQITPLHLDFFEPTNQIISSVPALGVMNGITLTNLYGSLHEISPEVGLVTALRYLARLTNHGSLLISIDTNQDKDSILKMYLTELNSRLNIASLQHIAAELPVENFDPSLFSYSPEWLPERQLLAHLATAKKDQDFILGNYAIHVRKGQKFHLFNSYKFHKDFFDACCSKANLVITKVWKHESGVMLYLLKSHEPESVIRFPHAVA